MSFKIISYDRKVASRERRNFPVRTMSPFPGRFNDFGTSFFYLKVFVYTCVDRKRGIFLNVEFIELNRKIRTDGGC